jgi:hypothetical protein
MEESSIPRWQLAIGAGVCLLAAVLVAAGGLL